MRILPLASKASLGAGLSPAGAMALKDLPATSMSNTPSLPRSLAFLMNMTISNWLVSR
jgi:hypothetical protein